MKKGQRILVQDGTVILIVEECGEDYVMCKAMFWNRMMVNVEDICNICLQMWKYFFLKLGDIGLRKDSRFSRFLVTLSQPFFVSKGGERLQVG